MKGKGLALALRGQLGPGLGAAAEELSDKQG